MRLPFAIAAAFVAAACAPASVSELRTKARPTVVEVDENFMPVYRRILQNFRSCAAGASIASSVDVTGDFYEGAGIADIELSISHTFGRDTYVSAEIAMVNAASTRVSIWEQTTDNTSDLVRWARGGTGC